jgi:hypothetical protein
VFVVLFIVKLNDIFSDCICECQNQCDCYFFLDQLIDIIVSNSVVGDDLSELCLN